MGRERRILDAAATAFHEKGFHGVGMDELGRRAGMSGPSLYRYFSGKDEILATLLNEAMDELFAAAAPTDRDARADLDRALRHHVEFSIANRHLVTLYQREIRSLVDPWAASFARRRGQYTRRWEGLVAAAHPDRNRDAVAATTQACLGMVFSVAGWPERAITGSPVADIVVGLLGHGLDGVRSGGT